MECINSLGGPFLVCGSESISYWGGNSSKNVTIGLDEKTDYALACKINGYTEVIESSFGSFLVLGDAPLETCIYIDYKITFIYRIWYCNKEFKIINFIDKINSLTTVKESVVYKNNGEYTHIFDSVSPGSEVLNKITFKSLSLFYNVHTYEFRPNKETFLIIHKFS